MLDPRKPPYAYAPAPKFSVSSTSTRNVEKNEVRRGPVKTSSLSVAEPSQTVITREIDPKTGEAKVGIVTNSNRKHGVRDPKRPSLIL